MDLSNCPKFDSQSRIVDAEEGIRMSSIITTTGGSVPNNPTELPKKPFLDGVETVYEIFLSGLKAAGEDGDFLGELITTGPEPRYVWTKYSHVQSRAQVIGSALVHLGYRPGDETKIGIAGLNCPEYLTTIFGCMAYSMTFVPLYHNYHQEAITHIINSCELEIVFCDDFSRVMNFLRNAGATPCLKKLVQMRGSLKLDALAHELAIKHGIEILDFTDIIAQGEANLIPIQKPKGTDLMLICHTSGTTGPPKGVMLTHEAMVMNASAASLVVETFGIVGSKDDVYLSYLPYAHIYENLVSINVIIHGARIGYFRGDTLKLLDDMQLLKPTIVAMVPRILNRLHAKIISGVESAGFIKRFLFNKALQSKLALLDQGIVTKTSIWDKLVFGKLQALLGGNLRLMYSGGAPISPEILRFTRAVFGAVALEGYGQTECCGCATLCMPSDVLGGNVGGPSPWAQIKLADVPDMEYFARDQKGEVLIRGMSVMKGYYKNEQVTQETVDKDGWLHTGDIGEWMPNGGLKIIDRKKEFFKLAQGDYVSPEAVEIAYSFSPIISQIYVTGWRLKSCLVSIVVPEMSELRAALEKDTAVDVDISSDVVTDQQLIENPQVIAWVLQTVRIQGAARGLSSIEQVRAVNLTLDPFTSDNGLLTPTMKLRRIALKKKYESRVQRLYDEIEANTNLSPQK